MDASPLGRLPAEIRLMVIKHLDPARTYDMQRVVKRITTRERSPLDTCTKAHVSPVLSLASTCRNLYKEMMPVFFHQSRLVLKAGKHREGLLALDIFLNHYSNHTQSFKIKTLTLDFGEWRFAHQDDLTPRTWHPYYAEDLVRATSPYLDRLLDRGITATVKFKAIYLPGKGARLGAGATIDLSLEPKAALQRVADMLQRLQSKTGLRQDQFANDLEKAWYKAMKRFNKWQKSERGGIELDAVSDSESEDEECDEGHAHQDVEMEDV